MEKARTPWGALKIKARVKELFSPSKKEDMIKNYTAVMELNSVAYRIMFKTHERGFLTEWESSDLLQEACLKILTKEIEWKYWKDPDLFNNLIRAMLIVRKGLVAAEKKRLKDSLAMVFPVSEVQDIENPDLQREEDFRKLYLLIRRLIANDVRLKNDKYIWNIIILLKRGISVTRISQILKINYTTAYRSIRLLAKILSKEHHSSVVEFLPQKD